MKKSFFVLMLVLVPLWGFAQSSESLVKILVDKEVITLEEATVLLKEQEQASKSNQIKELSEQLGNVFNSKYLKVGGYSQLLYSYNDMSNIKHDFSIRNAFISLSGNVLDDLSYMVLYNFKGSSITELYVTWTLSDEVGIRAGQQKIPLGIENNISLSKTEFIQNTLMMNHLLGGASDVQTLQNGKNNTGRDFGIKMFGDLIPYQDRTFVEYAVGLYQGSGVNSNAYRSNKDLVLNVLLKPVEGLKVGGGAYFGGAVYALNQEPAVTHVRNRWIASGEYKINKNCLFRAEYARAYDSNIVREGGYAMLAYKLAPKLQLAGQVEYLHPDRSLSATQMDYVGGVNYFMGKSAKLMLNYTYSDFSERMNQDNTQKIQAQLVITY